MCLMMVIGNKQLLEEADGYPLYLIPDQDLSLDYLGGHHGFSPSPTFW